jgi:hypothetical protein
MVCRVKENVQVHIVKRDQLVRRNRPVFNSLSIACVGLFVGSGAAQTLCPVDSRCASSQHISILRVVVCSRS